MDFDGRHYCCFLIIVRRIRRNRVGGDTNGQYQYKTYYNKNQAYHKTGNRQTLIVGLFHAHYRLNKTDYGKNKREHKTRYSKIIVIAFCLFYRYILFKIIRRYRCMRQPALLIKCTAFRTIFVFLGKIASAIRTEHDLISFCAYKMTFSECHLAYYKVIHLSGINVKIG